MRHLFTKFVVNLAKIVKQLNVSLRVLFGLRKNEKKI